MNKLLFERWYPTVIAGVAAYFWFKYNINIPEDSGFLGSSLTIGAILTGFMATSKAILMTLDSPIMQRIRGTDYLDDLVSYLKSALWFSFGFSLLCLSGYFIPSGNEIVVKWFGVFWFFTGVAAALSFIRITNIILKILSYNKNLSNP